MGRLSVILFDPDTGYANRLAAGLQRYLPEQTSIFVFSDETQLESCRESLQDAIFCCGIRLEKPLKERFPRCVLYYLQGESPQETEQDWDKVIFKYQSVRKIAAQILSGADPEQIKPVLASKTQQWYGVISPCGHENAEAFAVTLAQILADRKRVLLILFAEFSGIKELFDIPQTAVLEQLVLGLRKDPAQTGAGGQYLFRLGEAAVLCLPENPFVLYELTGSDIENLEAFIREETGAEAVVWYLDSLFCFGMDIMKNCRKVFCLEKKDMFSQCRVHEFYELVKKGYGDTKGKLPERLEIPALSFEEKGEHLLWQWKCSPMGEAIRRQIMDEQDDRA